MANKTKLFVFLISILGTVIGAVVIYFFLYSSTKPTESSLSPTAFSTPENPQQPITASTSLSDLPIGVSISLGNQWFESWAGANDILVTFSDSLITSSKPAKGRLGWNNPSFANIKQMENQWQGKVDIILYDYETWEKTPQDEQADPQKTAQEVQAYADEKQVTIIIGASWKMVTKEGASRQARENLSNINFADLIDKEKVQAIARHAKDFGVNASGLRSASPDSYIVFFKLVASYAQEVNPTIKLWPVLDARNQSADQMRQMIKDLGGYLNGIMIMGSAQDKPVISQLISLLRGSEIP
jgi:hypothetical protein